ncbi:MAG TPA: NDP-sugar synthase [Verrucomicrobiae bacterium]|nr:NDP-sugar synthase [Verrucomicrobiae bacterium]
MKAMVLCAGYGTRLGDLTREIPKPMLPLNGQPMLLYILANLKRHGFSQIIINLHFKSEMIEAFFGNGSNLGLEITYSHEPALLGTAGGLKNVEAFFRDEPAFLVHYGDIVTDQNFSAMLRFHQERCAQATLLLHQRNKSNSVVTLDDKNRIVEFLERPSEEMRQKHSSPWVNSGVCICSPEILNQIPPGMACDLPRNIFSKLTRTRKLFGYALSGYRCAVDSPERLAEVNAALADGRCHIPLPLSTEKP